MYFCGNILPPKNTNRAQTSDPTFHIPSAESQSFNLKDVPVRFEHSPNLEIGKIERSWCGDGDAHWIIGKLNNNSIESNYVSECLRKGNYYPGLSLQHKFTQYSDGRCEKNPVEVSICEAPRRNNCFIRAIQDDNSVYISKTSTKPDIKMSANSETPNTTVQQEKTINASENKDMDVDQSNEQQPVSSEDNTKVMEMALKMHAQLQQSEDEMQKLQSTIKKMEEDSQKEKSAAADRMNSKSNILLDAIQKHMAQVGGAESCGMDARDKEMLQNMQLQHPEAASKLIELCHCASSKAVEANQMINQRVEQQEKTSIEEKYKQMVAERESMSNTAPQQTVREGAVCASNKFAVHKQVSPNAPSNEHYNTIVQNSQQIREAFAGLASTQNATSTMEQLSKRFKRS